jgi:HAD superfamily hydrolase (TIGR01450 family)
MLRPPGGSMSRNDTIPSVSMEELIARYDALLFDAYGVIVHLQGAMPGAEKLIERLNRTGKPYYLVTNDASKLPQTAARRYRRFGLKIAPERIISSGLLLARYFEEQEMKGARCAVLGPADSERYVEQAGGEVVPADARFDALVIGDETGYPFLYTVDAAMTSLFESFDAGREVRLILPNPDLIYPRGERSFGVAAGSVALLFEAALQRRYPDRNGLKFARLGKPWPHLYEEALRRCGTHNAVMIGDQLETDIRGANACGIDSVLVTTGVSVTNVDSIAEESRPKFWMESIGLYTSDRF